jgi:hypothetical protein
MALTTGKHIRWTQDTLVPQTNQTGGTHFELQIGQQGFRQKKISGGLKKK